MRYVEEAVAGFLSLPEICSGPFVITEVVEGGATGIDRLAREWAQGNNVPIKTFEAKWDTYGKGAGPIRNREMALYADALIAIPSAPKSRTGTWNMISLAESRGLMVYIYEGAYA
jgi:hypothetical protein